MHNILIIGATRGLGSSLAQKYAKAGKAVHATARFTPPQVVDSRITWISDIDISQEDAGRRLARLYAGDTSIDVVIITAGYFALETFDEPKFNDEVQMYKTSAIGPVFIIHHLVKAGLLERGAKVILVSDESGSIGLRHESEGGGNFGHHGSKAALNMVGKLLSLDLKDQGIAVGLVHPGFMRTDMTKNVGYDKFYDQRGAVTPAQAADSLIDFIATFDMSKTGQYWAPRGPGDIGTVEHTMGPKKDLATPLQLPW
ncbi:hypothetical protein H2201_003421 [Coniosporium apollinis]|uniref:3-oxoacyl-[acyl-carrier protein] reductase n=2 Tax=Coniosporium TaxID=2810619 RepID=A0ABQ9NXN1_9PEZI|nr:hypothetical protein H2199_002137 [Cladosporium sp. JES 115]KAJ9666498.1 hypothetical protein H2201_003421 [Coniosporium apollinis]